jgi:hypothetical protein
MGDSRYSRKTFLRNRDEECWITGNVIKIENGTK